jgi:hypothetical protein
MHHLVELEMAVVDYQDCGLHKDRTHCPESFVVESKFLILDVVK